MKELAPLIFQTKHMIAHLVFALKFLAVFTLFIQSSYVYPSNPTPPCPQSHPSDPEQKNYKKAACLSKQKNRNISKKNSKKLKLKKYVILKITSHDLCLNRDAKKIANTLEHP